MFLVATNVIASPPPERPPTGMLIACAKRRREHIKPKDEGKIEKLAENGRKRSKETQHKERQAGAELGRLSLNWK